MDTKKMVILLICSVIVTLGIITGAAIFSSALAERPLTGSFSGSLTSTDSSLGIMGTESLMGYLGIFPSPDATGDYDAEMGRLKSELENNILSGKWPGFPYVSINGKLYFSRQAVDEWFLEKGKGQLKVD